MRPGEQLLALNALLGRTRRIVVTQTRLSHLKQRLKNFTPEELEKAAKTIASDDFMVHGGHNTIDYLLRNDEKVEYWLAKADLSKKKRIIVDGESRESPF